MSKASTTIEGFVAKDPELGNHQGKAVTNVSVAHTPRRLNKQTNQWEDAGPTLWVQASFWEADAEAIVANVSKGSLVTITGQPEINVYQKQDGTTDAQLRIKFGTLGVIPRADQPVVQSAPAPTQEPWSTPGSFGDDTPFSDHYPVRQIVDIGGLSDRYPATVTATGERVFCGCTDEYRYDYGHETETT